MTTGSTTFFDVVGATVEPVGSSTFFDTIGAPLEPVGSAVFFDTRGVEINPTGSTTYFDTVAFSLTPVGSPAFLDQRGTPIDFIFGSASSDISFGQDVDTNVKVESVSQDVAFGDGAEAGNIKVISVSNDIVFDSTPVPSIKLISVSSDIAFGQENIAGRESQVSVESSVAFDSVADSNVKQESPSSDVLFDQDVVPVTELQISLSSDINFGQTVEPSIKLVSVESNIGFGQSTGIQRPGRAENSLGFLQQVQTNVIQVSVESSINFSQDVLRQAILSRSIEQSLSFTDQSGPTTEESVSSGVAFGASAFRAGDPSNDVLFDQVVVAESSKGMSNDVAFDQLVKVVFEGTKALSNNVAFGQAVVAWIERNCDLQEYKPFGVAPIVVLGTRTDVTLVCGADSITLRNPDFTNSEVLDVDRALNISRGGTPQLIRDTQWPKTTEHSISFRVLTRAKAQELLDFFKNCLGLLVTYTDYENRIWEGVILNPESAVADGGNCKYTADIQFIGNPT